MSDTKSPSAFAPAQTTGTAPVAYTDAPTPQHVLSGGPGGPGATAAAYTDTQGVAPPAHDTQKMVGDAEKQQAQMQRAAHGDWTHGFWDCFSPGDLCFKSCCCPCFVYGKTQARLEDPSLRTYESVNAPCGIFCLLNWVAGAGWAMAWLKRMEMRRAYNIKGSGGMDCFATCCCPCCALMQMDKEVVSRQAAGMPGAGAVVAEGYQAPQGMAMAPAAPGNQAPQGMTQAPHGTTAAQGSHAPQAMAGAFKADGGHGHAADGGSAPAADGGSVAV